MERLYAMLWERGWHSKINYDWLKERILVHGHTMQSTTQIANQHFKLWQDQFICIDNGCVFNREGYGNLLAFDLTNQQLFYQKNMEADLKVRMRI